MLFALLGGPKGLHFGGQIWLLFGLHFCSLLGGPVLGLAGLPKSLFFLVLNPSPGPGVRKFSPAPGLLKNLLKTF